MSTELEQDDLAALALLDELARISGQEDTEPVEPPPTDAPSQVLRRIYLEGVALLAYDLVPATPRPSTRATLLAHLVGDETQEISPLVLHPPSPAAVPPLANAAPAVQEAPKPTPEEPATPVPSAVRGAQARPSARPRRWPAILAALLAVVALGLGVWVALLQSEIAYRDTKLRDLQEQLGRAGELKLELEAVQQERKALEERHHFATAASASIFALRPPVGSGQPTAWGLLVLAPDRRHWQLEVRGLRPEPEPQDYQIWFMVDGLPLSGGVFDAKSGRTSWLADDDFPAATSGLAITLERKGGTVSPTSPILLAGESSLRL